MDCVCTGQKISLRQPTNASRIGRVVCSVRTKGTKWKELTDTVTYFIVKGSIEKLFLSLKALMNFTVCY